VVAEEAQLMIDELGIYEIAHGKMAEQHRRFSEITLGFFKKHGFGVEWFATPLSGEWTDRIYYLLSFEDLADRERKCEAFTNVTARS
jgi:hypothetical protein